VGLASDRETKPCRAVLEHTADPAHAPFETRFFEESELR
jgi:hypothetical protein